jgi:hypothetical protein
VLDAAIPCGIRMQVLSSIVELEEGSTALQCPSPSAKFQTSARKTESAGSAVQTEKQTMTRRACNTKRRSMLIGRGRGCGRGGAVAFGRWIYIA